MEHPKGKKQRKEEIKLYFISFVLSSENESIQSLVAQLKEYKELVDLEIITQEEFDAKKEEILR